MGSLDLNFGPINDVVFVVEDTSMGGSCMEELYQNYIVPCLEHFNGGTSKEIPWASMACSTTFSLVRFQSADCLPRTPVSYRGPFTSLKRFETAFKATKFIGGAGDMHSSGAEGLAMALNVFDRLNSKREKAQDVQIETSRFIIYVANSPPYELPVEFVSKYVGLKMDEILKKVVESKVKMSIFSPRKIPVLFRLFKDAGGDITKFKDKNYARDPKHLVILNGFELQSLPLIQPTPQAPLPSISPILPPISAATAQTPQINVPTTNAANPQPSGAKLAVSQNNPTLQQPTVSGNVPSSQPLTNPIGAVISAANPAIPNSMPGAQRPIMPNQNTRMPVNPVQRGPRPTQPWQNPQTGNSPSDILRAQLTSAGGKGAQGVRNQGPRPAMSPVGGKGSPQSQMKPGQKQLPGKQIPMSQGNKTEADSSVGISPTSSTSSQLPMGGQMSTIGQPRPQNSTLKTLLNTAPVSQRPGAPIPVGSNLRQQLTRPGTPNMTPGNRIINPQGAQLGMQRPTVPVQQPGQSQPGGMNPQSSGMDQNQGIESRKVIWTGELQWKENSKVEPNTSRKQEHTVVCSVTSKKDDNGMPEVKPDNWPPKLIMQLIPKTLVQKLGGHFFNHSRSVLFHPQKSESLDILTKVLGTGYAGCVHFSGVHSCEIKVLILLYSAVKNAYLGFIPNEQTNFVEKIREEIRKQKMERINPQSVGLNPNNPGAGMQPGAGPSGINIQQSVQPQMQQQVVSQQQPNMLIQGTGAVGGMSVGNSTMGMTGGTITVTGGNPGQAMGLMNTRLQNPGNMDPSRLQRIQQLQAELQREYQGVGQVQGAQPVTSMGQQGLVTGPETMVMGQNRMINAQSMQQQGPGGLRQILQHQQQPQFAIRGQMQPGGIMQQRMMQPQQLNQMNMQQQQQQQQQQQSDPMLRELLG